VAPLVSDLKAWMRAERAKLSRHSEVAKAMEYMLKRWGRVHALPRRRADFPNCVTSQVKSLHGEATIISSSSGSSGILQ
jgi:hypothetical protein